MQKRHGLYADGTFWYTASRRLFTYRYKGMWTIYRQEIDESGVPVEGGADDWQGSWTKLADAAAAMHEMDDAPEACNGRDDCPGGCKDVRCGSAWARAVS